MLRRSAALFLALAALASTPAMAQSGTEAEQEACTPDVFRLCQDFIPNEGPILACLQAKHAQLSPACEPVIFPHEAATSGRTHRRRHKTM